MRVNILDLARDTRDCGVRRSARLRFDCDLAWSQHLLIGHVEAGPDIFPNSAAMIFRVTGDANDCDRLIKPVTVVDAKLTADRILPGEEVSGHRFIHNGHPGRGGGVLSLDAATGENRDSDYAEIVWANVVFICGASFRSGGLKSRDEDGVIIFRMSKQTIRRICNCANAGS